MTNTTSNWPSLDETLKAKDNNIFRDKVEKEYVWFLEKVATEKLSPEYVFGASFTYPNTDSLDAELRPRDWFISFLNNDPSWTFLNAADANTFYSDFLSSNPDLTENNKTILKEFVFWTDKKPWVAVWMKKHLEWKTYTVLSSKLRAKAVLLKSTREALFKKIDSENNLTSANKKILANELQHISLEDAKSYCKLTRSRKEYAQRLLSVDTDKKVPSELDKIANKLCRELWIRGDAKNELKRLLEEVSFDFDTIDIKEFLENVPNDAIANLWITLTWAQLREILSGKRWLAASTKLKEIWRREYHEYFASSDPSDPKALYLDKKFDKSEVESDFEKYLETLIFKVDDDFLSRYPWITDELVENYLEESPVLEWFLTKAKKIKKDINEAAVADDSFDAFVNSMVAKNQKASKEVVDRIRNVKEGDFISMEVTDDSWDVREIIFRINHLNKNYTLWDSDRFTWMPLVLQVVKSPDYEALNLRKIEESEDESGNISNNIVEYNFVNFTKSVAQDRITSVNVIKKNDIKKYSEVNNYTVTEDIDDVLFWLEDELDENGNVINQNTDRIDEYNDLLESKNRAKERVKQKLINKNVRELENNEWAVDHVKALLKNINKLKKVEVYNEVFEAYWDSIFSMTDDELRYIIEPYLPPASNNTPEFRREFLIDDIIKIVRNPSIASRANEVDLRKKVEKDPFYVNEVENKLWEELEKEKQKYKDVKEKLVPKVSFEIYIKLFEKHWEKLSRLINTYREEDLQSANNATVDAATVFTPDELDAVIMTEIDEYLNQTLTIGNPPEDISLANAGELSKVFKDELHERLVFFVSDETITNRLPKALLRDVWAVKFYPDDAQIEPDLYERDTEEFAKLKEFEDEFGDSHAFYEERVESIFWMEKLKEAIANLDPAWEKFWLDRWTEIHCKLWNDDFFMVIDEHEIREDWSLEFTLKDYVCWVDVIIDAKNLVWMFEGRYVDARRNNMDITFRLPSKVTRVANFSWVSDVISSIAEDTKSWEWYSPDWDMLKHPQYEKKKGYEWTQLFVSHLDVDSDNENDKWKKQAFQIHTFNTSNNTVVLSLADFKNWDPEKQDDKKKKTKPQDQFAIATSTLTMSLWAFREFVTKWWYNPYEERRFTEDVDERNLLQKTWSWVKWYFNNAVSINSLIWGFEQYFAVYEQRTKERTQRDSRAVAQALGRITPNESIRETMRVNAERDHKARVDELFNELKQSDAKDATEKIKKWEKAWFQEAEREAALLFVVKYWNLYPKTLISEKWTLFWYKALWGKKWDKIYNDVYNACFDENDPTKAQKRNFTEEDLVFRKLNHLCTRDKTLINSRFYKDFKNALNNWIESEVKDWLIQHGTAVNADEANDLIIWEMYSGNEAVWIWAFDVPFNKWWPLHVLEKWPFVYLASGLSKGQDTWGLNKKGPVFWKIWEGKMVPTLAMAFTPWASKVYMDMLVDLSKDISRIYSWNSNFSTIIWDTQELYSTRSQPQWNQKERLDVAKKYRDKYWEVIARATWFSNTKDDTYALTDKIILLRAWEVESYKKYKGALSELFDEYWDYAKWEDIMADWLAKKWTSWLSAKKFAKLLHIDQSWNFRHWTAADKAFEEYKETLSVFSYKYRHLSDAHRRQLATDIIYKAFRMVWELYGNNFELLTWSTRLGWALETFFNSISTDNLWSTLVSEQRWQSKNFFSDSWLDSVIDETMDISRYVDALVNSSREKPAGYNSSESDTQQEQVSPQEQMNEDIIRNASTVTDILDPNT